jgi:hypothetical protein
MKAALLRAGKTVPEDASADDIELMHLELEAEEEALAAPKMPEKQEAKPEKAKGETYLSALARLQTPEAGSKTPAVIEWARANLSKKEFSERYPNL